MSKKSFVRNESKLTTCILHCQEFHAKMWNTGWYRMYALSADRTFVIDMHGLWTNEWLETQQRQRQYWRHIAAYRNLLTTEFQYEAH